MKLAKALAKLGQGRFDFQFASLHDVPLYNEDLWSNPPASVLKLKSDIEMSDAVLIVTPEYNRHPPAVTTNAMDWASRPPGKSSWANKVTSVIGASPGSVGTAVSQSQVRSSLVILGTHLMGQPEIYLTFKPGVIDDNSNITDEHTKAFLEKYLSAFEAWIAKHKA